MSWVSTREVAEARTLEQDDEGHFTYARSFLVEFNSALDGAQAALTATGIPAFKSTYSSGSETNTYAICNQRSVSVEEVGIYRVDLTYTTRKQPVENPLDEPARFRWQWAKYEKPFEYDVDDDEIPVANSAGDPFENAVIDDSRPVLVVVRNEETFDATYAHQFRDKINDATWNGFPEKTVKIQSIQASDETAFVDGEDLHYWIIEYSFEFREETWTQLILDKGMRRLGSDGEPEEILIKNKPIASPVLLDGDGDVLPLGDPAVLIEFNGYKSVDFDDLGITIPA